MTQQIFTIHVPLATPADDSESAPYAWIETAQEYVDDLDGGALSYDDGEEWETESGDPEYLFFLHDTDESRALDVARAVAHQAAATGTYVTVGLEGDDMGEGRRIDLAP